MDKKDFNVSENVENVINLIDLIRDILDRILRVENGVPTSGEVEFSEKLLKDLRDAVYNLSDEDAYSLMSIFIDESFGDHFYLWRSVNCEAPNWEILPGAYGYTFDKLVNVDGRPAAVVSILPEPLVLGVDCTVCISAQDLLGYMIKLRLEDIIRYYSDEDNFIG